MNDRKQHVIHTAHELFVEKGFQATSIQDIIDYSGISKGTFYNYFSSKNELLMAIFTSLRQKIDEERNHLLVGQDPSDITIFIKQLELELEYNGRNKLFTLFEEAFFSKDPTLKQFLKDSHIRQFHWTYERFVDLFGKNKEPYLLDCAILFHGMLHQTIHFNFLVNGSDVHIKEAIYYTVKQIEAVVVEAEKSGITLFEPKTLEKLLPDSSNPERSIKKKITECIETLKNAVKEDQHLVEYYELLDFIQEEMSQSVEPRKYLIRSALSTLGTHPGETWGSELSSLKSLVDECLDIESS